MSRASILIVLVLLAFLSACEGERAQPEAQPSVVLDACESKDNPLAIGYCYLSFALGNDTPEYCSRASVYEDQCDAYFRGMNHCTISSDAEGVVDAPGQVSYTVRMFTNATGPELGVFYCHTAGFENAVMYLNHLFLSNETDEYVISAACEYPADHGGVFAPSFSAGGVRCADYLEVVSDVPSVFSVSDPLTPLDELSVVWEGSVEGRVHTQPGMPIADDSYAYVASGSQGFEIGVFSGGVRTWSVSHEGRTLNPRVVSGGDVVAFTGENYVNRFIEVYDRGGTLLIDASEPASSSDYQLSRVSAVTGPYFTIIRGPLFGEDQRFRIDVYDTRSGELVSDAIHQGTVVSDPFVVADTIYFLSVVRPSVYSIHSFHPSSGALHTAPLVSGPLFRNVGYADGTVFASSGDGWVAAFDTSLEERYVQEPLEGRSFLFAAGSDHLVYENRSGLILHERSSGTDTVLSNAKIAVNDQVRYTEDGVFVVLQLREPITQLRSYAVGWFGRGSFESYALSHPSGWGPQSIFVSEDLIVASFSEDPTIVAYANPRTR